MFKCLAISGAGINGLAFLGGLQALEENDFLNTVTAYSGSSAGALICTLVNMGYDSHTLKSIMMRVDFGRFLGFSLDTLIRDYGASDARELTALMTQLFKHKGYDETTTFQELHHKTNKFLNITGSCLSKATGENRFSKSVNFNVHTDPSMSILTALRISICLPWIYCPVKYKEQMYVDGALLNPYPIAWFTQTNIDPHKTLTIGMVSYDIYENVPTSLDTFSWSIILAMMDELKMSCVRDNIEQTVVLENLEFNCFDFGVNKKGKILLYNRGYSKVSEHITKKLQEKRVKWLSFKYLTIWRQKSEISKHQTN